MSRFETQADLINHLDMPGLVIFIPSISDQGRLAPCGMGKDVAGTYLDIINQLITARRVLDGMAESLMSQMPELRMMTPEQRRDAMNEWSKSEDFLKRSTVALTIREGKEKPT